MFVGVLSVGLLAAPALGQEAVAGGTAEAAADRAEAAVAELQQILDELRGEVEEREAPASDGSDAATGAGAADVAGGAAAASGSGAAASGGTATAGAGTAQPAPSASEAAAAEAAAEPAATRAAVERAERAARAAEDAAMKARRVAYELQQELEAYRARFARTGPYLGAAGLYAVEDFDASLYGVKNSGGVAGFAGYRVHRYVAVELRGEVIDGFEVNSRFAGTSLREAEIDGFVITGGPKVYPLSGAFQPWVGIGVGAFRAKIDAIRGDGSRVTDRATEPAIRPAAGIDLYLSEYLALQVEAAYVSPGGQLENLDFAVFSAGAMLRF